MSKNFSHPALTARRKFIQENEGKNLHPRARENGKVYVDHMPLAVDLIGLRPLTMEEQIARFDRGEVDHRLIPNEHFMSEDDFHDYLDGLPPEGLSPYELEGFKNIEFAYSKGRYHTEEAPPADLGPSGPSDAPKNLEPSNE